MRRLFGGGAYSSEYGISRDLLLAIRSKTTLKIRKYVTKCFSRVFDANFSQIAKMKSRENSYCFSNASFGAR